VEESRHPTKKGDQAANVLRHTLRKHHASLIPAESYDFP
jgi:hypothetical protein